MGNILDIRKPGGPKGNDSLSTPRDFFSKLNEEFGFMIDVCATDQNKMLDNHLGYITNTDNGLTRSWKPGPAWCNPPYSDIHRWLWKAIKEARHNNVVTVMLLPVRTDTRWFHDCIVNNNYEVRFIRGRIKFGGLGPAPFASMIVVIR